MMVANARKGFRGERRMIIDLAASAYPQISNMRVMRLKRFLNRKQTNN